MDAAPPHDMPGLVSLIPLMVMTVFMAVPMVILAVLIARQKGQSAFLYGVLAAIPYAGFFSLFWLASRPDMATEWRLRDLELRVAALTGQPPPPMPGQTGYAQPPQE